MAEGLRPLSEPADKGRVGNERLRATPGREDVDLRVRLNHSAVVLDRVAVLKPACMVTSRRRALHRHVDAVESVVDAAEVVGERRGSCRTGQTLPV